MEILHFDDESLKKEFSGEKLIVVDFFATWCGPCKMLSPILEELRNELNDDVVIGKVDIDENFDIARSYGVMSVPTLILIKNGEEVERSIGLKPKVQLLEMINKHMEK